MTIERIALRIFGCAGTTERTRHDDRYIKSCSPDPPPFGTLETTDDIMEAKLFCDHESALAFWRQQHGFRERSMGGDGKPNRPLTMYHVEILHVHIEQQKICLN